MHPSELKGGEVLDERLLEDRYSENSSLMCVPDGLCFFRRAVKKSMKIDGGVRNDILSFMVNDSALLSSFDFFLFRFSFPMVSQRSSKERSDSTELEGVNTRSLINVDGAF
jgi:hypothetical protein